MPSILQQGFVSVGNIVIQSIVNSFGTSVIAGYAAAVKINNFAVTCFNTLGNAMSNYCAQNMGAGRKDRIKQGFKSGIIMSSIFALLFTAAFVIFRKQLIGLFMNSSTTDAMVVGTTFLIIISPFFAVVSAKLTSDGVLRGTGAMKYFMITTFTDLLLRVGLAFILSKFFGSTGIWLAWPIGWTVSSILSLAFYGKGVWKKYNI